MVITLHTTPIAALVHEKVTLVTDLLEAIVVTAITPHTITALDNNNVTTLMPDPWLVVHMIVGLLPLMMFCHEQATHATNHPGTVIESTIVSPWKMVVDIHLLLL
jgi:hypothetical protein